MSNFFNKYPYTDFHELNLDWVLTIIKQLQEEINNFINLNTIKYADPIDWNITSQYQKNTVVFDNVHNIAYLSTRTVPAGVLITNTDYWTAIMDLTPFFAAIGDIDSLDTETKTTLVDSINEIVKEFPYTFTTLAAHSDVYDDGDLIITSGYSTRGIASAAYRIHDTTQAYYIPFGDKYAELIVNDGIINIDSLGGNTFYSDDALNTALALAVYVKSPSNISSGYYRGTCTIKFEPHAYNFAQPITLPTDIYTIKFEGERQNTELLYQYGSGTFIDIPAPGYSYNDNIEFKNLVFEGHGNMIKLDYANNCRFDHCIFMNQDGNGLHITRSVDIDINDCLFLVGNGTGLVIDDNTTTVHINRGGFRNGLTGLLTMNSNGIYVTDTIIEYLSDKGFYAIGTRNLVLNNVWIEATNCLVTRSDIELRGVRLFTFPDNTHSHLYIIPHDTAEKYTIICDDAVQDIQFSTTPADPFDKFDGHLNYIDGTQINFNTHEIIAKNSVTCPLPLWTNAATGFVEFYGNQGTYLANYDFVKGVSLTVTKIGGSLNDPEYINSDDGIAYTSLTASGMFCKYTA